MATFEEIKEVRLRIDDPEGFIDLLEVSIIGDLPAIPQNQTAYKVISSGVYVATDLITGATSADYEIQDLYISDPRLSTLIDSYGIDKATCRSLQQIVSKIGKDLGIKKNTAGAENVEYTSLKDTYEYYKGLLSDCKEDAKSSSNNNTGRWGGSKAQNIAGGNV